MKIPHRGSQAGPTRQEFLSSHMHQETSLPYALLLSLPGATVSKTLVYSLFSANAVLLRGATTEKTSRSRAKGGGPVLSPGMADPSEGGRAAAGSHFF